jgi:hypothetical protein
MAQATDKRLVFYTGQKPVTEMLSSVDPSALGEGQFSVLENLSIGKLKVTARWGCDRIASAPEANAAFRGSWNGYIDGNYVILAAFRVGSETKIYSLTSAGTVWTELSSGSGATARFATDGWIQFGAGTDPGYNHAEHYFPTDSGQATGARREMVLCGNGTDEPGAVYYSSGFAFVRIADTLHATTPLSAKVEVIPQGFYYIGSGSGYTSYTNSGANLTMADSGSDPNTVILLTFNAAGAVADTSIVNFEGGSGGYEWGYAVNTKPDFTYAKQLHILIEDTITDPIFDYLLLEAYDSTAGSYKTVYDPTAVNSLQPIYTAAASGVYLASLPISDTTAVDVSRFRLTVKKLPSANRTANIRNIMVGGMVDAAALYRSTSADGTTRVESRAISPVIVKNQLATIFGGKQDSTVRIPMPEGTYWANYQAIIGRVDTNKYHFLYRKDPEDEDFFLCSNLTTAGATHCAEADKDYARKAPSEYTVRPPKASAWCGNNNRVFAGGISGDTGRVMASVEGYPTRFESLSRDSDSDGAIDDDSGANVNYAGEQVKRIVPLPGSLVGISPIATFTNRNVWRQEGIDALSLSRPTLLTPHGTLYPFSIAVQKGNVYWLDSEKQPRVLIGGMDSEPLGIWKIEDQLIDNVVTNCTGIVFKEAYKLAYAASGATTNKKVLNYEERLNGWHRHSYTNPDWAGYVLDEVSQTAGYRLLGITTTGEVFEIEKASTTADDQKTGSSTDAISITITTGEMHGDLDDAFFWGRVAILCEKMSGVTLTVTRSDPAWTSNDGATTGTIDLSTGVNERAWRYDQTATTLLPTGIKSQAMQLSITGAAIPGKFIKGAIIEISRVDHRPDVAA